MHPMSRPAKEPHVPIFSSYRPRSMIAAAVCLSVAALLSTASSATASSATASSATASSATASSATASSATPTTAKPTIVITHGAWADGSSFARVVRGLQAQGYTVDVPANPLAGLASDTATLADYLKTVSGPIVLVGHSYGGMVITDAATGNAQVKALVYVDAYIPAAGESALQLTGAQPGSCLGGRR